MFHTYIRSVYIKESRDNRKERQIQKTDKGIETEERLKAGKKIFFSDNILLAHLA